MIKEFKSGKTYRYKGKKKSICWASEKGNMDFVLDGKSHKCKEGRGNESSFFDSSIPNAMWSWTKEDMQLFEEVGVKLKNPTHLVVWEVEGCGDPCEFFIDEKAAKEKVKKLFDDSSVKKDSIILVEIKSAQKVNVIKNVRLSGYKI